MTKIQTLMPKIFRRYGKIILAPMHLYHSRNSYLLPGPKELPKFFDALSESFCDNDTVPDPSGELRADASGRVALVQEYESGPILLVAYRTA